MIDLKLLPSLFKNGEDCTTKEIATEVKLRTDGITVYTDVYGEYSLTKVTNAFKDSKTDEVWGMVKGKEIPQCFNVYGIYGDKKSAVDAMVKRIDSRIESLTKKKKALYESLNDDGDV
jgi:hypothetical protein